MLSLLRRLTPKYIIHLYHRLFADLANTWYRSPSEKMIVIGVTGTSGKSTVVYLIAKMLERAGYRVGVASTIFFKVDQREWLNDKKMTMVGRFQLQGLLSDMVKANCQYAIVETTSEGIVQYRHRHVAYDTLVFTNLYPEHIESHGSFENYKNAKLTIFKELINQPRKTIAGQKIKKTVIANVDDEHAADFLSFPADEKIGFSLGVPVTEADKMITAKNEAVTAEGIAFAVDAQPFVLQLLGRHSIYNALTAIAVGQSQGLSLPSIATALGAIPNVPGRIEFIREGQPFTIIVDYAFEPVAMLRLYETIAQLPHRKIIHVFGASGGGRDADRRPKLGKLAGEQADLIILTQDDPYDDDLEQITDQVAAGAIGVGKIVDRSLLKILDRREAIQKALSLAKSQDIVVITGKGSEQVMAVKKGRKIPWDDRQVVREELKKLSTKS
jgi:UDP-N-acetylmuramoyl-L-alanyl-D-glutamate--2,6-diaminopimelate ligase